jgi:hypothetical protein
MKNGVFWDVTPCGAYSVVLTSATRPNIPEDAILPWVLVGKRTIPTD